MSPTQRKILEHALWIQQESNDLVGQAVEISLRETWTPEDEAKARAAFDYLFTETEEAN